MPSKKTVTRKSTKSKKTKPFKALRPSGPKGKTTRSAAPVPSVTQGSSMKMMFVASHGLQTPLSAVRWGSSRLRKAGAGNLTKEQSHLVDGIAENAKTLSRMLDAMLILAKMEEGGYQASSQKIYLHDFLTSFVDKFGLPAGQTADVRCPDDLMIETDRGVLETIVQSLLIAASSSLQDPKTITIDGSQKGGITRIGLRCVLQLSLLSPVRADTDDSSVHQLVGGATGLMLSIAHSMARAAGGGVELTGGKGGEYELVCTLSGN